jgi:integrase
MNSASAGQTKKRRRGTGRIFLRGGIYWISYCVDGKERRESAHTNNYDKAERLLNRRIVEMEDGRLPAPAKQRKKSIDDLLDDLVRDYIERKKRSASAVPSHLIWLRQALGDKRAASVTKAELTQYVLDRRAAGDAESTIRKHLQLLGQAYRLQKAIPMPDFPQRPKAAVRDMLIAPAEQQRLIAALEDECDRHMAEFYFATGWRGIEIRGLQWPYVRTESDVIRLIEENSKTGEPRDFPLTGKVAEIIARREAARLPFCPFVFRRHGRPVSYREWLERFERAAIKCRLRSYDPKRPKRHRYVGVKPHDSRRSFCTEAMDAIGDSQIVRALSGHKSNTIFERYRIVKVETLKRAIEKREQYVAQRAANRKVVPLAERRNALGQFSDNSDGETRNPNAESEFLRVADIP